MNRISQTFHHLKLHNKKAIVPYITPEYPMKGTTVPLILGLEHAGASMIEIGIPFSDPLADGPTIQHSSDIAIRNGATIGRVFECVKIARKQTDIPLILMGYINPVLHYGVEQFMSEAKDAGVDGLIVPDVPPEESDELRSLSKHYGVSNIFLIAPTSPDERIQYLDEISTDFTYCVSVTGVTGARTSFSNDDSFENFLTRVRKNTKKPFVVGFGIKSKEQIKQISAFADGVVIGSALIQAIKDETNIKSVVKKVTEFLLSLKS